MYFKRLEVFGFKSFADKTTLNFEPGITAVVGPNGCGKSNIFDAIRWGLGEQSMKELRGATKEDVIFNGTETKPSLGFAEVSLTFSNESRMLAIEYDEVTVTRRLYRSGESEYLLNKTPVRLKDIQELLMGTGIGAEAYSLVQQGKVDLVVSAKPEDRRIILDEASGITKYKAKKREALSKLASTDANLLRVNDIVVEVKRQIASIERQASKAKKYKEEFEKLKDMEVRMAKYQTGKFTQQKDELKAKLAEMNDQELKFIKDLEELSQRLTNEINFLDEIEQSINELRSQEIKLDGQIDLAHRQISFNEERIENLAQNDQRLEEQKNQLIERCRLQQAKVEELKQALIAVNELIQGKDIKLKERRDHQATLERSIREAKDKIKEHEEKILQLMSYQVSIRNELTDIMKEIQGGLARKRRLDMENEKVGIEKKETDEKLQTIDYQITNVRGTISELKIERDERTQVFNGLRAKLADLEGNINELEKKKLFFISQKEFTEKLNAQYQDMPDPIVQGKFITDSMPLEHHTGVIGKVKWVRPIDSQRSSFLRFDPNSSEVKPLYEIICETKFIELDPQQISLKINEIEGEIVALNAKREELLKEVDEKKDILERLEQDINNKEKAYSILMVQKKDITENIGKLTGELELVDTELIEVGSSLEELKKKEEELNYRLDTLNQDLVWAQNDIKERQEWITAQSQEKESATVSIAQLETEIQSERDKLTAQQDNLKLFIETLDSWLEEINKIEQEVASHVGKKEQFEKESLALKEEIEKVIASKASIHLEVSELESKKNEMGQKINSMRANINGLEDEVERIQQDKHQFDLQIQQLQFGEQALRDRLMQAYRINIDELDALFAAAPKVEIIVDQATPSLIEASLTEEQTIVPCSEVNIEQHIPVVEEVNEAELSLEIEKLRKRCDSYGNVNLAAMDEYEELKQRFEFLTKQQSDLIEAKSQLMSTITKINRSTRQMFMDTFTRVSEEFRIYYRMLFGGGEAELVLLDPENVLESGIEIIAKPPGKKLQSISLLSGGEKTLTAIALIFGVFKVNPSPFCVLDEIDAALDESNVGRFSYLLKDFAKIAQFVVITHNKKTIESADILYGITMPETGVSRIVSVKFGEKQKNRENEEVPAGV